MGDYHNQHFKKDLLFSVDVFETFIATCLKLYGLDPCQYFSSPGLNCNAMLKITGVKLEKISDVESTYLLKKD